MRILTKMFLLLAFLLCYCSPSESQVDLEGVEYVLWEQSDGTYVDCEPMPKPQIALTYTKSEWFIVDRHGMLMAWDGYYFNCITVTLDTMLSPYVHTPINPNAPWSLAEDVYQVWWRHPSFKGTVNEIWYGGRFGIVPKWTPIVVRGSPLNSNASRVSLRLYEYLGIPLDPANPGGPRTCHPQMGIWTVSDPSNWGFHASFYNPDSWWHYFSQGTDTKNGWDVTAGQELWTWRYTADGIEENVNIELDTTVKVPFVHCGWYNIWYRACHADYARDVYVVARKRV